MALIEVTVIEGVFTSPRKHQIVERVTDAMVATAVENMRQTVWCIVEEVASDEFEWGVGCRTPAQTTSRRSRAAPVRSPEIACRITSTGCAARPGRCADPDRHRGPREGDVRERTRAPPAAARRPATRQLFDVGLSYRDAARSFRTRGATITTRLHRRGQHVAREPIGETKAVA
jgi:phenylpyruvate tautomerase PptA (4-oxalocrotonate tautomerase family)